jgi:hypothetical protein
MTAIHAPELLGQTVVVIGGSAGIGLELAPIRVNLIAAGVASSSAPRCRSGASSARPTSPHWPSTS